MLAASLCCCGAYALGRCPCCLRRPFASGCRSSSSALTRLGRSLDRDGLSWRRLCPASRDRCGLSRRCARGFPVSGSAGRAPSRLRRAGAAEDTSKRCGTRTGLPRAFRLHLHRVRHGQERQGDAVSPRERMHNTPAREVEVAAGEQFKITALQIPIESRVMSGISTHVLDTTALGRPLRAWP